MVLRFRVVLEKYFVVQRSSGVVLCSMQSSTVVQSSTGVVHCSTE